MATPLTDADLIDQLDANEWIHMAKSELCDVVIHQKQLFTQGFNAGGRPDGMWVSPGGEWIKFARDAENPKFPVCCYIYKVVMPENILRITDDTFAQFDAVTPSYWLNMDYFNYDAHGFTSHATNILDMNKLIRKPGDTTYSALIRNGIIFDDPLDAMARCEFYRRCAESGSPIEIFKYKNWEFVAAVYEGVIFELSAVSASMYLWYKSLDVASGCIWNTVNATIVPIYRKVDDGWVQSPANKSTPITGAGIGDDGWGGFNVPDIEGRIEIVGGVDKDKTMSILLPETISECALTAGNSASGTGTCTSKATVEKIGTIVGSGKSGHTKPSAQIMADAKEKLGCNTERCVLSKLSNELGPTAKHEINLNIKVKGPTNSELLSNVHIDDTMKQWGRAYPKFFPYNFNMRNFASYSFVNGETIHSPDTLATITFSDLWDKGFTHCGCVINKDVYQGSGTHWMALFADARGMNNSSEAASRRVGEANGNKLTVEFFNSSGNAPAPEWVNWMQKTKNCMEEIFPGAVVTMLNVSSIRHQRSKSECGLYSLFYIWARLHNVPPEYFMTQEVQDEFMFEFRQHLFADASGIVGTKFDWETYKKNVNIEWEKGSHG